MSKGFSGLFKDTLGFKDVINIPNSMLMKVSNWAKVEAIKLESKSKRQRDKFNTACIVYDESTGKEYFGRNNGIEIYNLPKNPIIFGDKTNLKILPNTSLNHYKLGNCAEVDVINKALNDGAKLKDLHISVIHATKDKIGQPKNSCLNCTYTFKGKIKKNNTGWYKGD